ncbi:hypothetical protein AAFF_G00143100 [Aldrovandia affinis]|uniref:Uncharacterized protein n=1 Tax=Aldrovandia affinis TaxID=143900 RepID=A0AAD7T0D7_9TELE|nr:hypothetical protein AAFF_G00143100 [Aldrovandia affinis]
MEVLAKAAVAEITKLVEESSAVLRLEMSRTQYENEALRTKLKVIECELVLARVSGETKVSRKSSVNSGALHGRIQISDGTVDKDDRHSLEESVFGGGWGGRQWRDGEVRVVEEDIFLQSVSLTEESTDVEKDVPASLLIKEKVPKADLMNDNHNEGLVISGERPLDFRAAEMRPPIEHQHFEAVCNKRLTSVACPDEQATQPIAAEVSEELQLVQLPRCGLDDDRELAAKAEEREPAAQMLGKSGSEHGVRRLNSPGTRRMFERDGLRGGSTRGCRDFEPEEIHCTYVNEDSQQLSLHTKPQPIWAGQGSGTPSLGSPDVIPHVNMSSLACVKEEVEIKSICIEETGSERFPRPQGQDRETLYAVKSEDLPFQPGPQQHQPSDEGMRITPPI